MSRVWYFSGAESGDFRITSSVCLRGETLPAATHLTVAPERPARACVYSLCGVISNERYVTRPEKQDLVSRQVALGRPNATVGAFIPLKKSAAWWLLPQDERRKIFEADSKHIAIGLRALPQIARRLHHCRDLVEPQPFDFLTWFDFAPEDTRAFDDLLGELRATEEWTFVEREIELRVERDQTTPTYSRTNAT